MAAYDKGDIASADKHALEALENDPQFEDARLYISGRQSELSRFDYSTKVEEVRRTVMETRKTNLLIVGLLAIVSGGIFTVSGFSISESIVYGAATGGLFGLVFLQSRGGTKLQPEKLTYYIDDESGDIVNQIAYDYVARHIDRTALIGQIVVEPNDQDRSYIAKFHYVYDKRISENETEFTRTTIRLVLRYVNSEWEITQLNYPY